MPENHRKETWKPIKGFEDRYHVSSHGRIRRYSVVRGKPGGLLRPHAQRNGYLAVGLRKNKRHTWFRVHRLVAETFIGPCPPKCEVNHKDGDKNNNRMNNLEYVTHKQNQQHASANGLMARGERHPASRFSADQVRYIRQTYKRGFIRQKDLAKDFGTTQGVISKIVCRKRWAHIK